MKWNQKKRIKRETEREEKLESFNTHEPKINKHMKCDGAFIAM